MSQTQWVLTVVGLWLSVGIGIVTYKVFESRQIYRDGILGFLRDEYKQNGRALYWYMFCAVVIAPVAWPTQSYQERREKRRRAAKVRDLLTPIRQECGDAR